MIHGHELEGGMPEEMGVLGRRGQSGEDWDKCNRIINKIHFLKIFLKSSS